MDGLHRPRVSHSGAHALLVSGRARCVIAEHRFVDGGERYSRTQKLNLIQNWTAPERG